MLLPLTMNIVDKHTLLPAALGGLLGMGLLLSLFITLMVQLLHLRLQLFQTLKWAGQCFGIFFVGGLGAFSVWVVLFAITGSFAAASLLLGLMALLLGAMEYLMQYYRSEPFVPQQLGMALQLPSLASMLSVSLAVLIFALLLILAAMVALCVVLPSVAIWWPVRLLLCGLGAFVFWRYLKSGRSGSGAKKLMTRLGGDFTVNARASYDRNGYLLAFLTQCAAPMMERPEGYSSEVMGELVAKYQRKAAAYNARLPLRDAAPNIIFVMSEALSDPTRFASLHFSRDPLENIRCIMAESTTGSVLAPGYGGGTAHCEFEALTGLSTALCNGLSPYENAVYAKATFPSMARNLSKQGYNAVALHPYHSGMYARPAAYKAMGFSDFIDMSGMVNRDKIDRNSYISDAAAYEDALLLLQKNNRPSFIHLVTMQNHGGYKGNRFDNTIQVEGLGGKSKEFLEIYSQGLCYTDEATRKFLDKLEALERETVVVFWGDHLPIGYPATFMDAYGREKFETPFFLWSSSGCTGGAKGLRSPLFFQAMLPKITGGRISPFVAQLMALEQEIHGVHLNYTINAADESVEEEALNPRAKALLEELYLVEYDLLMGQAFSDQCGYFDLLP